eukprot:764944-Hanusia_phi.AAC.8
MALTSARASRSLPRRQREILPAGGDRSRPRAVPAWHVRCCPRACRRVSAHPRTTPAWDTAWASPLQLLSSRRSDPIAREDCHPPRAVKGDNLGGVKGGGGGGEHGVPRVSR